MASYNDIGIDHKPDWIRIRKLMIIGLLDYGMTFLNINQYWKYVVLGIALLAAVTMDTLQTRAAANAAKKVTGSAPTAK